MKQNFSLIFTSVFNSGLNFENLVVCVLIKKKFYTKINPLLFEITYFIQSNIIKRTRQYVYNTIFKVNQLPIVQKTAEIYKFTTKLNLKNAHYVKQVLEQQNHKTTLENDYEDSEYAPIVFFFKTRVSGSKKQQKTPNFEFEKTRVGNNIIFTFEIFTSLHNTFLHDKFYILVSSLISSYF